MQRLPANHLRQQPLKTSFGEYYERERSRSYSQSKPSYVALTRAVNGMFIIDPHPDVRKNKTPSLPYVIRNFHGFQETPSWNESSQEYNSGELIISKNEQSKSSPESLRLFSYPAHTWRDRLVIRQTGRSFFDQPRQEQQDKIGYGIYIHTLLSRISYASEIPDTLDRIILEGLITHDERDGVMEQLQELMNNPQIAYWFDPSWDVRTEMPVLLPTVAESIDRFFLNENKLCIDFNTEHLQGARGSQDY